MKKTIKRLAIAGLLVVLVMGGCLCYLAPHPPKEAALIENFRDHRASFEKLRDLLETDTQLRRVAAWGVEMDNPFYLGPASGSKFSPDCYRQYLALLKEVNGIAADRHAGAPANPDIYLWTWGWADDTQHIGICWLANPPENLINTIDGHRRTNNDPAHRYAYRYIDQNWYLFTDR